MITFEELRRRKNKICVYTVTYRYLGLLSAKITVYVGCNSQDHLNSIQVVVKGKFGSNSTVESVKEKGRKS